MKQYPNNIGACIICGCSRNGINNHARCSKQIQKQHADDRRRKSTDKTQAEWQNPAKVNKFVMAMGS